MDCLYPGRQCGGIHKKMQGIGREGVERGKNQGGTVPVRLTGRPIWCCTGDNTRRLTNILSPVSTWISEIPIKKLALAGCRLGSGIGNYWQAGYPNKKFWMNIQFWKKRILRQQWCLEAQA